MEERRLSSKFTITFKYSFYIFFVLFLTSEAIAFLKSPELGKVWVIISVGLIAFLVVSYLKSLKEVSFSDKQMIIRDFRQNEVVDFKNIKRIFRIDTGTFYRIEYLEKGTNKYVDVWPSISLWQMMKGELPHNFQEFVERIS